MIMTKIIIIITITIIIIIIIRMITIITIRAIITITTATIKQPITPAPPRVSTVFFRRFLLLIGIGSGYGYCSEED